MSRLNKCIFQIPDEAERASILMDLLAEVSYQISTDVSLQTLSQRCPVCDISSLIFS